MTRRAKQYLVAAVATAVTTVAASTSNAALSVFYTFEDGTDTTIQNFGTGPANGSLVGAAYTFVEGTPAGRALKFNSNQATYIDTGGLASALLGAIGRPPAAGQELAADYTMSAVVTLDDTVGDNMVFGYISTTQDALHNGFRGAAAHQGHWGADQTGGAVVVGTRLHVTFRYSDVANNGGVLDGQIFINGLSVQGPGEIGGLNNDQNIMIGSSRSDGTGLGGTIDNVRIYDNALTNAEILALATSDMTFVPEPSAAALLLGVGALVARRRRQSSPA